MADNPKANAIYQRQLIKNEKKNMNSINIINSLNSRCKIKNLAIEPQTMIVLKQSSNKYSAQKSVQKQGRADSRASFLIYMQNNTKLKPHTLQTSPSKIKAIGFKHNQDQRNIQRYRTQHKIIIHPIPPDSLCTSPKIAFPKSKRKLYTEEAIQSKRNMPGPGQYNIARSNRSASALKFGRQSKLLVNNNPTPGPGVYKLQRSMLLKIGGVFFRQKREYSLESNSPGPARYASISLNKIKQNTGSVVINRNQGDKSQERLAKSPGPGQYSLDQSLRQSRILGGRIGKEKRSPSRQSKLPGPHNYSPKYEGVLTRSPTCKIGSEIRQTSQTNIVHSQHTDLTKLRKSLIQNNAIRLSHKNKPGLLLPELKLQSSYKNNKQ